MFCSRYNIETSIVSSVKHIEHIEMETLFLKHCGLKLWDWLWVPLNFECLNQDRKGTESFYM